MTDDQIFVWEHYESATCVYDADAGTFKVFRHLGEASIALSSSWQSRLMAWAEAASRIRERETRTEKTP